MPPHATRPGEQRGCLATLVNDHDPSHYAFAKGTTVCLPCKITLTSSIVLATPFSSLTAVADAALPLSSSPPSSNPPYPTVDESKAVAALSQASPPLVLPSRLSPATPPSEVDQASPFAADPEPDSTLATSSRPIQHSESPHIHKYRQDGHP